MNIILLERVEKLGKLGDVVTVKPGYARNYLLPTGKAMRASKANLETFETERAEREKQNAEARAGAETAARKIDGLSVVLVRAASEMGQLFGSVSAKDIADAATKAGHKLDKRQIIMDKAIKSLGLFPVKTSLHSEVQVTLTVNVARSTEEAKTQARTGVAVIASEHREDTTRNAAIREKRSGQKKAETKMSDQKAETKPSDQKAETKPGDQKAETKPGDQKSETKPGEKTAKKEVKKATGEKPSKAEADSKGEAAPKAKD